MIGAIIQARCESIRFPNKVLTKINHLTTIELLLKRVSKSKLVDKIIVATSSHKSNKELIKILKKNNVDFFIGSQKNVLDRYFKISNKYNLKTIIELVNEDSHIVFSLHFVTDDNDNIMNTLGWILGFRDISDTIIIS